MEKVFISYSREDKKQVFKIKDEIENRIGKNCWIDLSGIESDQEFSDIIISAINSCEVFLFMYSQNSANSVWARKELTFAEKKRKRIVFVKIDDSELVDWFLFNYSGHDIIDYSKQEQTNKLLSNLHTWCGIAEENPPKYVKTDYRKNLILCLSITTAFLLALVVLNQLLEKQEKTNSKEVVSFDKTPSDAMMVDLGLKELTQTKKGISNKLIQYESYSTSYNHDLKIPNWVSYELYTERLNGNNRRTTGFSVEPLLSDDSATTEDYKGSGFDRGHMAPAGDMKWSKTAMKDCFYLCNICPQTHELNSGLWEQLEIKARNWAKQDTLYICCGPIVSNNPKWIKDKIAIPDSFYKVIAKKTNGIWKSIGFVFPNKENLESSDLIKYAKTVDEIEKITGHDFFYNISEQEQIKMESSFNSEEWE